MLVVRRSFKNYGEAMLPGSVVTEPGNIKWLKTRIKDRYLVEVDEHNIDKWNAYFKDKYGVSIEFPEQTEQTEQTEGDTKVQAVKPVVKTVVAAVK